MLNEFFERMDEFVAITGASKKQAEKFLKQQNNQLGESFFGFRTRFALS